MNEFFVDMHIHIGRTMTGKPVKITGAKSLTFTNIIETARNQKGLDLLGIIDCHSPEVLVEMNNLITEGIIKEHADGGLQYGETTIIIGSELEIYDEQCHGPIHVLCYFPTVAVMTQFSQWLSGHLKNIQLSSQRTYVSGRALQKKVKALGGLFIPAHIFTPFKSLYGKGVLYSLEEVFDPTFIDGIELGLSADTYMASQINELDKYAFLSNSDAHSLAKIAREYQVVQMKEATFTEFKKALHEEGGRRILANYGLDPQLGKYYQTVCSDCMKQVDDTESECRHCGSKKIIKGVARRVKELADQRKPTKERPPYVHQVPLEFIPGLGPKTLEKLLDHFGSEMAILHDVPLESLKQVVPEKIAYYIEGARAGTLTFQGGGGGVYGKISE